MSETEPRPSRMSSTLGKSALVLGNVDGTGDLEIRGRVQGDVHLSGRCLVADEGSVQGRIEALHITVAGVVRGDLLATDGISISASAVVEGNIEAPRVSIETGAQVHGQLRIGGGREPIGEQERETAPNAFADLAVAEPPAAALRDHATARRESAGVRADRSASSSSFQADLRPSAVEPDPREAPEKPAPQKRPSQSAPREAAPRQDDTVGSEPVSDHAASISNEEKNPGDAADAAVSRPRRKRRRQRSGPRDNHDGDAPSEADRSLRDGSPVPVATSDRGESSSARSQLTRSEEATAPQPRTTRETKGPALPTFVKGARGHLRH